VYLDEAMDPETNVFARSVLLHELVHYVQDMNEELIELKDCERWYGGNKRHMRFKNAF
jgi:hypothetical protein